MFLHFLQKKEHKEAFLELAQVVANADGYVHKKEQNYINSYLVELGIQQSDYKVAEERELAAIIGNIEDEQVKNIFLAEILLLIFVDGDYNDDEKKMALNIKQLFGLSDETFEALKDWVIRLDQLKIEGLKLILDPS